MKYLTFSSTEHSQYSTCFLVPMLNKVEMVRHYVDPHFKGSEDSLLAYDLYKGGKKTKVSAMREYLADLLPILADLSVTYLVVADADYFKLLTKTAKAESVYGYVLDVAEEFQKFGAFKAVYCPNFRAVFYDPEKTTTRIEQALSALKRHQNDSYDAPGIDIIHFAAYPKTVDEIAVWLQRLLNMDCDLAIDTEAFSLKHHEAGIGTIAFAWNLNEGVAFSVDYEPTPGATQAPYGRQVRNEPVRALLKEFFRLYLRKAIWHHATFDVSVLVYQLFMADLLDTEGLLEGLEIMTRNFDDTRIITYLATNSCAGNKLGLKDQAQEFAGNYAESDIEDITRIPLDNLLRYNLIDTLSTWFVRHKHWDRMVADQQLDIYENLMKPGAVDIIQMQLTGLPMDRKQTILVRDILQDIADGAVARMQANPSIAAFTHWLTSRAWEKDFEDRKAKAKNPHKILPKDRAAFPDVPFNPNSGPQLQVLLFDENFFALPVLDLTPTKAPATGGDTLEALVNHAADPSTKDLLQALVEYSAINKLLTAFMPHFLDAPMGPDGHHYLYGYFKLGGTVSGRLSSSDPNLQNLPANVTMVLPAWVLEKYRDVLSPFVKKGKLSLGKLIKSCFTAPPGWLFCGLDFASLEDRISALTTKDPNKLKVYTDNYDGHCLRAYSYFGEAMPDIDPDSVASINSIESKYPAFRQDSKAPTFALTYQGTYQTLIKKCGFTEAVARKIEANYHELYVVSDNWVAQKLDMASKDGYVTVAFGLRLRTPLLYQVVRGTSRTPREADAEGRTAGNALGQSYGLLNTRAGIEFNRKVRASKYRLDIRPNAHIHDAQYFMIRDALEPLLFTNEHLVKAVSWQEDPLIQHDLVKLGGELSVFHPNWAYEMGIPNGATETEIIELAAEHHSKVCPA